MSFLWAMLMPCSLPHSCIYTHEPDCFFFLYTMKMWNHCMHVSLGKRNLRYIQPLFLCVQMSIESEMSHQRFRFLLQSGVWHLFSYFAICVSCAACVVSSPKCMIMQPSCSHNKESCFVQTEWPVPLFLSSLLSSLPSTFSILPPLHPAGLPLFISSSHFLFLRSIQTRATQGLSQSRPSTMPTPQAPLVPVWLVLTLTAALPAPS